VTADFDVFPAVRSDVAQYARCHAASGMTVERFAKNLKRVSKCSDNRQIAFACSLALRLYGCPVRANP
jgi:hypothetical protein